MKNRFLKSISLIISVLFIVQLSPTALTAENYFEEPMGTELIDMFPPEEVPEENFGQDVSETENETTEAEEKTIDAEKK